MAAALTGLRVLNILAGVLGFIPFAAENFGGSDSVASVIRVTVGLDVEGGLQNAGGDLPDVRLFNEAGEFIGISTEPGDIGDGSTAEIKVSHNSDNGQQAAYALFTANDNAICVASISITWPNGDQYGWLGDWGQACEGSWYFSNVFVKGSDYKPKCLWIDANGDQPQTGFQIHFPEFVIKDPAQTSPDQNRDYYCNAGPPFRLYTDPEPRSITYWVLKNKKSKRNTHTHSTGTTTAPPLRTRIHHRRQSFNNPTPTPVPGPAPGSTQSRFSNYLVTSNTTAGHSATLLCGSKTSVGPDFANTAERLFCRMSDKTLWPFCDGVIVTDNCFDAEGLQQLIVGGKAARGKRYVKVVSWGGEEDGEGKGVH
jgi:hypothetical protein